MRLHLNGVSQMFSRFVHSLRTLPALGVAAVLALVTIMVATTATTAVAAPPVRQQIDQAWVDPDLSAYCGFPVGVRVQGPLIMHDGGNRIEGANYRVTYTNMNTGRQAGLRTSGHQVLLNQELNGNLLTYDLGFRGGSRLVVPGTVVNIDVGYTDWHYVFDVTDPNTWIVVEFSVVSHGKHTPLSAELLRSVLSL